MSEPALSSLAGKLRTAAARLPQHRVVVGFDGFVDEMIRLVGERHDLDTYTPVPDISTYAQIVGQSAGLSSLREIVITATHPGGCAVNFGDGIAALGVHLSAFATLGEPIHPAFADFAEGGTCAHVESWGDTPGRTLAFEFNDGKLMYSAVEALSRFTPESVAEAVAKGTFREACTQAGLITQTNWTLYPHMSAVWKWLQENVYNELTHRPHFLVDLVDPSARGKGDILAMLEVLPGFEASGPCALGVNTNEAVLLGKMLGLELAHDAPAEAVAEHAARLREKIGLTQVFVHDRLYAAAATATEAAYAEAAYTSNPKKSTGAGDRFNAGYGLALLLELPLQEALCLGSACSGFFVRNARSANAAELTAFVENWANGAISLD